MKEQKVLLPWVNIKISGEVYAVSCENVTSLCSLGDIVNPPNPPKEIRGMIKFRDHVIELLDLKSILGFSTVKQEIIDFNNLMDMRLNDHINWLEKLKNIVLNDLDFDLITDPHKCAFGKWYDSYNPESSSIMFQSIFSKFDKPHKQIHNIAIQAEKYIKNGEKSKAIDLIEKTKDNELKQMIALFDEIKQAYQQTRREIVIVLNVGSKYMGMAVDEVLSIEYLTDFEEDLIKTSITSTEYLLGIAKRKSGSAVILLNDDYLLETF